MHKRTTRVFGLTHLGMCYFSKVKARYHVQVVRHGSARSDTNEVIENKIQQHGLE